MRVLSMQVESGDDTVKLKVLQAIVSLLTTHTNIHGESLSQVNPSILSHQALAINIALVPSCHDVSHCAYASVCTKVRVWP